MSQAYLDFFTLSLQPENSGIPPYSKRISIEQKQHEQIMEKIFNTRGNLPQLEKDPLLSTEADYAVDLKQFDGYTLKSEGTFVSRDKDRVGISKASVNLAKKFGKKLREKAERKNSESTSQPDNDEIKEVSEEEEKKEEDIKEAEIVKDEEAPKDEVKGPAEEQK